MAISLNSLARSTDAKRKEKSKDVVVKLMTVVIKPGVFLREYVFQTFTPEKSVKRYRTTISPLDPKNPDLLKGNAKVSVSCSCDDFKYRWEVANHMQSASKIKYSNGAAPLITNPSNKTSLCKHLIACMPIVLSRNTKDIEVYKRAEEKDKVLSGKKIIGN